MTTRESRGHESLQEQREHEEGAGTHGVHEHAEDAGQLGFDLPKPAVMTKGKAIAIGVASLVVIGAGFLLGWLPRYRAQKALVADTVARETALLRVQVVSPKPKSSDRALTLPGSVQALRETMIYPRASGYIRSWAVDIGDKVKEGAVLAEIDTPEVDQQLDQARAQLAQAQAAIVQAKANSDFSKTNLERYKTLAPKGVASQQELDKQQAQSEVDDANVKVAQAAIDAALANVGRLTQLKSFARVTAPFAGTINSRTIERGQLVSPTSALFRISATDPVRVFVQVPQDVAPSVKLDVPAKVSVREYPGREFDGKVARSAGALDSASRTMTTEIRVPNEKGELLAGMYAQVALTLPSPHRVFELPPTALLNDAQGVRVGVVTEDNKIKMVPVVLERDNGSSIDISAGLAGNERIVRLVGAEIVDGRQVEVIQ
ncbi:MAG: efflux RND transporter periplasmic adaptor subunit [Polyangiaceae bacterium]|nr:efflux RND transporter periplasmic adaptor subunit [Polyangiaceae bacterium]